MSRVKEGWNGAGTAHLVALVALDEDDQLLQLLELHEATAELRKSGSRDRA